MRSLDQIRRDEEHAARQRLARAEAVYNGFNRRRDDARARLAKIDAEAAELREALGTAAGEEREALAEIEAARMAIADLGSIA